MQAPNRQATHLQSYVGVDGGGVDGLTDACMGLSWNGGPLDDEETRIVAALYSVYLLLLRVVILLRCGLCEL